MELARVFAESGIEFDATLVFMTVAGEEQGLIGAGAHAKKAKAENIPIQAWFNNDIVGNSRGGDGIVDGATIGSIQRDPRTRRRARWRSSRGGSRARYVPSHRVRLMARRDRFGRGGDHSAFNAEGFAAIGFRESRENYAKQHGPNDTIDGVDFPYLAQNAASTRPPWPRWRSRRRRPVVGQQHARRADDRSPAVGLRRAPALGGVAGRGRLPDLLAQRLGAGLGARDLRRQRDGVHVSQNEHRRLGLRGGRRGRGRAREHDQRVRRAAAHRRRVLGNGDLSGDFAVENGGHLRRGRPLHQLERFDEVFDRSLHVVGGLDELNAGPVDDHAFLQLTDMAMGDAALEHDRALAERNAEIVQRVELEREGRFDPDAAARSHPRWSSAGRP